MSVRQIFPSSLKIKIRLLQRYLSDVFNGSYFSFATKSSLKIETRHSISVEQFIRITNAFENKIHNIKIAAEKINQFTIEPGKILSFWKAIGKPGETQGFKKGRNLINGKLKEDFGGGLCQLSSILYYCSLKAGLQILERHNHSVDIYRDADRFTPLGGDATIVYGNKDFRIINPYQFRIRFEVSVIDDKLYCELISEKPIEEHSIIFERAEKNNTKTVRCYTELKNEKKHINTSVYALP